MSETRIEIESERGKAYRLGELVSGQIKLSVDAGGFSELELRVERRHDLETVVLSRMKLLDAVPAGSHTEPFRIPLPKGSFAYETRHTKVELWLVAEAFGAAPGKGYWRLQSTGRRGIPPDPVTKMFDAPLERDSMIGVVVAMIMCLLAAVGLWLTGAVGFGLFALVAVVLIGAGGALLGFDQIEDISRKAASSNLSHASLELNPTFDGSALQAMLRIETADAPDIQKVVFRWIATEGEWRQGKNGPYWHERTMFDRPSLVTVPDSLAPNETYEFSDEFEFPADTPPTFATERYRVHWSIRAEIHIPKLPAQILRTNFGVVLQDELAAHAEDKDVVAVEWAESASRTQ